MASCLIKDNFFHNKPWRGRFVPFLSIAWAASWNHVLSCMFTSFGYCQYVILRESFGFKSTISTAVIIGFFYLFPLFSSQGIWNVILPRSPGFFSRAVSKFSFLSVFGFFVILVYISAAMLFLLWRPVSFRSSRSLYFLFWREIVPIFTSGLSAYFSSSINIVFSPLGSRINKFFSVGRVIQGVVAVVTQSFSEAIYRSRAVVTPAITSALNILEIPSVVMLYAKTAANSFVYKSALTARNVLGVFHWLIITQGVSNG